MAVYTDITDEELASLLADFDIGAPLSLGDHRKVVQRFCRTAIGTQPIAEQTLSLRQFTLRQSKQRESSLGLTTKWRIRRRIIGRGYFLKRRASLIETIQRDPGFDLCESMVDRITLRYERRLLQCGALLTEGGRSRSGQTNGSYVTTTTAGTCQRNQ